MQPILLMLTYELADGEGPRTATLPGLYGGKDSAVAFGVGEDGSRHLELRLSRMGDVLEVRLEPLCNLKALRCMLAFAHDFGECERVLLNGYQSWTDTHERAAHAPMRGLGAVPRLVVDNWAIDRSGDYRFVEYANRAGCQHGFTYGTFRVGARVTLVASLDESHGFTLIRTDAETGSVTLETECPLRELACKTSVVLGRYLCATGTGDEVYDRYAELYGGGICAASSRGAAFGAADVKPSIGYTSWYRHYTDIDEAKLAHDAAGMRKALSELGLMDDGRMLRVFQVDDGFTKVGDWLSPNKDCFPNGMAAVAESIRAQGFLPGLWLAPFICERDSQLALERPDWLLREGGEPVPTGPQWSGGLALDTRNPEVRTYVIEALHTATAEWGFGMLKLDFLFAACMMPHDGLNRGELMADAIDLVLKGVAPGTLLLGCGVPLASVFGRFDYCRIGCDVGLDWDDKPYMRLLHRERVSTKNSLGNTIGRAPLDGRLIGCDPDVFFLRDDVRLSWDQRLDLLAADAVCGHMLLTSDDMGLWSDAQKRAYRAAVAILLERFSH